MHSRPSPSPRSADAPLPWTAVLTLKAQYDINEAGRQLEAHHALSATRAFAAAARLGADDAFVLGGYSQLGTPNAHAVVVGLDGTLRKGDADPALTPLISVFSALFRHKPDVQAGIYTQSPASTSFALAHRPIPIVYSAFLYQGIQGEVPISGPHPFNPVDAASTSSIPALLLRNQGLLAWGRDLPAIARFIISLEENAEFLIHAETLGGAHPLPGNAFDIVQNRPRSQAPKRSQPAA